MSTIESDILPTTYEVKLVSLKEYYESHVHDYKPMTHRKLIKAGK